MRPCWYSVARPTPETQQPGAPPVGPDAPGNEPGLLRRTGAHSLAARTSSGSCPAPRRVWTSSTPRTREPECGHRRVPHEVASDLIRRQNRLGAPAGRPCGRRHHQPSPGPPGFIGNALCDELLRQGFALRAYCTRSPARWRHLTARGVQLIEGDLSRARRLQQLVRAVPPSSTPRAPSELPNRFRPRQCRRHRPLADRHRGCRPTTRLLLLSSLAAREPQQLSWYAASKRAAERRWRSARSRLGGAAPARRLRPGDRGDAPRVPVDGQGIAPVPGDPRRCVPTVQRRPGDGCRRLPAAPGLPPPDFQSQRWHARAATGRKWRPLPDGTVWGAR